MTFPHCPLCVALAVMTTLRAASHVVLLGLRLSQEPASAMATMEASASARVVSRWLASSQRM